MSLHCDTSSVGKSLHSILMNGKEHVGERYNLVIQYLKWQLLEQMEDVSGIHTPKF